MHWSVIDPIQAEADAFVGFIGESEKRRFSALLHLETHDGIAVAFYRRAVATADAQLLGVVLDEEGPGEWAAMGATEVAAGGARHVSARPSKRGDWVLAIFGSAPTGASVALLEQGDELREVSIREGVYAFMARTPAQPEGRVSSVRFK